MELKTARSLGVSLKRFRGWTPSPEDPAEWDDVERDWMLALETYERAHVCPVCGMDTRFCHDEQAVASAYSGADVETCFVGQLRERALRAYTDSGEVKAPNSQTTKLVARTIR